jgi:8-amino-7-oxononanoate synthase
MTRLAAKARDTAPALCGSSKLVHLLQEQIALRTGCATSAVETHVPISRFALESVELAEIASLLEASVGVAVDGSVFADSPSIDAVVARVLGTTEPARLGAVSGETVAEVGGALIGELYGVRFARLNAEHEQLRAEGLYFYQSVIEEVDGCWVTVQGRRMLMASSYAYLGLSSEPRIHAAAQAALERYGCGSHGSPMLAGTTVLHRELEQELASFKGTEAAMLYSSGFVANVSTIATLVGPGDVVITDHVNHASIAAGCRHSRAKILAYRHNDLEDLEACLLQAGAATKLVVADAVFSMSGTILELPEVTRLCRKHGALLMVDEAHSLGVLGATGKGIEEHFGMPTDTIDVKMGTLSKTIPSAGGYVAANSRIVNALKHNSHGFIFSGALPPPQVAAALEAVRIMREEPGRVTRLRELSEHYRRRLREGGLHVLGEGTPIVPVLCSDVDSCLALAMRCQQAGVFALPVVYPAVPLGSPRLRTTVTASHTMEDVDFLAKVIIEAAEAVSAQLTCVGAAP